jgi:hypothetical protein
VDHYRIDTVAQAGQPVADRNLSSLAAGHDINAMLQGQPVQHRSTDQLDVIGWQDEHHPIDPGAAVKSHQRMPQNGQAVKGKVLLSHRRLHAQTASTGNDDRADHLR